MGQLIRFRPYIFFCLASIVALGLFLVVRPFILLQLAGDTTLVQNTQDSIEGLRLGTETQSGFSQVLYSYAGKKVFLTTGEKNSSEPFTRGQYVTFVTEQFGYGQIFRYHLPSHSLMQITSVGNNRSPRVNSKGQVVWELWEDDHWSVSFFDGLTTTKISGTSVVTHPDIGENSISYGARVGQKKWELRQYLIADKSTQALYDGPAAKYPIYIHGQLMMQLPGGKPNRVP